LAIEFHLHQAATELWNKGECDPTVGDTLRLPAKILPGGNGTATRLLLLRCERDGEERSDESRRSKERQVHDSLDPFEMHFKIATLASTYIEKQKTASEDRGIEYSQSSLGDERRKG
jgi:hypothetical protein